MFARSKSLIWSMGLLWAILAINCNQSQGPVEEAVAENQENETKTEAPASMALIPESRINGTYTEFTLEADLSHLSENQKKMIGILIDVADIMDELFWQESYGERDTFLASIPDEDLRRFAEVNYGPWDRLNGNAPFIKGYEAKSDGAQFYPQDITKDEVTNHENPAIRGLYTMVRRTEDGGLAAIPYHEYFDSAVKLAAGKLREAAALADDAGFKKYLELRATALETDEYRESDLAWMDMKTNAIDFVVGPIEVYEDKLFNYKAAHEGYVLIKDQSWSERLAKYAALLPELQRNLPVDTAYKQETPGTDSDLNAYDVVYYAGDCNAGSKTIAINLPNDEKVQLEKGTRRLQLKNAMKAKFDKIMVPIAGLLIAEDQRQHVTFDAFFANTMFHEVAHGLGIKNTINDRGTVREALKETGSALEEGKADILGLYMVNQLLAKGEVEGDIKDYYVTFIAGIFRSIRFGSASAHGKANLLRFNFFENMGAFSRDEATGTYRVHFDKVEAAMTALSKKILTLQGDGDYEGVLQFMEESGKKGDVLQQDLDRLNSEGIPTDIVFKQGKSVLGL